MTRDLKVSEMILSGDSIVDMTQDGSGFNVLTVENLQGNGGMFKMDIDASQVDKNDKIYITKNFTGTQYVDLNEIGQGNLDGAVGTVLASVKDGDGQFIAKDGEGTLFWNRYELDKKDTDDTTGQYTTDWYLKDFVNIDPYDKPTASVATVLSTNSLNYHTWRTENDKLMQRMGELRRNGEQEKGVWFRIQGSKIGRNGRFGFGNKYTVYELGYDEIVKRDEEKTRYQGLALSCGDGNSSYTDGSGDNRSRQISFYNTEVGKKGHYLDIVLKMNNMDNDFKVFDNAGKKITGEYNNTGVALSAEYGRRNDLPNDWYIEPQIQLTLGYLGGDNYQTDNGINAEQSGIKSALGRLGFNIGKKVGKDGVIYAKANLMHEFGGGYTVDMYNGQERLKVRDSFSDTWLEYGIGASVVAGQNSYVYFDVERSACSDFYKNWQWNAGVRWSF